MVNLLQYIFHTPVKIKNAGKMKHSFVRYIGFVYIASQKIRHIQAYYRKSYWISLYKDVTLHSKKKHFCHTKLQRVIRVVLSKFLYLIANWSSDPKPIKEILAILIKICIKITHYQLSIWAADSIFRKSNNF